MWFTSRFELYPSLESRYFKFRILLLEGFVSSGEGPIFFPRYGLCHHKELGSYDHNICFTKPQKEGFRKY